MTERINPQLTSLLRPISELHLDPGNARIHDKRSIAAITDSLKAHGQQKPIIVDKSGKVIAGNGTMLAAQGLGWDKIAAALFTGTAKEAKAYAIRDNRSALLSTWDDNLLAEILEEMKPADGSLESMGFSDKEFQELMDGVRPPLAEDDVPDPPKNPVSKIGDIWVMGKHRLLCGDSTKLETYEKLMGAERSNLVFTDPPYGVNIVKSGKVGGGGATHFGGKKGKVGGGI